MSIGRVGSYELLERLGEGGQSVVFRARDTRPERLDRVVAIKILKEDLALDPESRARLIREARAEAALSHTNIATCYEVGEGPLEPADLMDPAARGPHPVSMPFLAMEYVPGVDLGELAHGRALPVAEVARLGLQIAAGLEAAHRAGVVHRDLKPGNVRVTPEGTVKIVDFGLARVRPPEHTDPSESPTVSVTRDRLLGTLPYLSPEQAQQRPVDARSDLFALGTMLYQLVSGRLPFDAPSAGELLVAIARDEPPPLARFATGVPGELERIVRKLLAKRPEDRYQSAHDVATDLTVLRDSLPNGRSATRPRPVWVWALAGGAALAAATVLYAGLHWLEPASTNIVVLPFTNATGDSSLTLAASGFADEVQRDLVRRTELNVASPAVVAALPASERTPRRLAHSLGVGVILDGVFSRRDGLLRLDTRLMNARTGFDLWGGGYDWSYAGAQDIRREVVDQIALRLGKRPRTGVPASAARTSAGAYEVYLQGVRLLEDADDPLAPDHASEAFGRALVLDPEYAPAWAGRSKALFRIHAREHDTEALTSAERAADNALKYDPGSLEGRVARAQIYRGTGRTAEAVAELQQVLRANPNWDEAYLQLGATYRDAGDLAAAEKAMRRAVTLGRGSWRNWNALGAILLRRGDRAGARAAFEQIIALAPGMNRGYEQVAAVDLREGRYAEAIAIYRRLPTPVRDAALASNIANAYIGARRLAEASDYLALAVRIEPRNPLLREHLGDLLVHLGRAEDARAAYAEAARLTAEELRDTPERLELRVQHALHLAKSGDCASADRGFAALGHARLAEAPELLYALARARAACGQRGPALAALREALAHGVATSRPREDVEFDALRADPDFVRLTGAAAPPGGTTTGPP
jgi:serine/threonine protein kinase/tetratricopeptide (TPR) repeat protein